MCPDTEGKGTPEIEISRVKRAPTILIEWGCLWQPHFVLQHFRTMADNYQVWF